MIFLRAIGFLLALLSLPLLVLAFAPAPHYTLADIPVPAAGLAQMLYLSLDYPSRLQLGDTETITLSLNLPAAQEPPGAVGLVVDAFANYNVLAVVHINAIDLRCDPIGDISLPLRPGQQITWRWQITAEAEPGRREVNLIARLRFIPQAGGETIERAIWARRLTIEAPDVLGMPAGAARALGFTGGGVGFILLAVGFIKSPNT